MHRCIDHKNLSIRFQSGLKRDWLSNIIPHSPALNLIEILWRFIKYHWLPFSAYTSFQCLIEAIEEILTRVGTDYTITFQGA